MIHLTPARIAALMEGTLGPAEARQLAAHLGEDCEICEAAVEHGPDLDVLARLLEASSGPPVSLDAADRERLWRGVELPRRTPWWRGPGLVGALLLAAAALLFLLPSRDERTVKGACDQVTPEITLRVVAGHMGSDGLELERRVTPGEALSADLTLIFELEADREAARYLFAVDGDDSYQLHPTPGQGAEVVPPGRVRVPTGFGLDDVDGPLRLVAGAASEALTPQAFLDTWRVGGDPCGVGIAVETVEVAR